MLKSAMSLVMQVRIGPRLIAGFVLVAAGCAFLGYKAMDALGEIRAYQVNVSSNLLPSVLNLDKARSAALRVQRAERTLITFGKRGDEKGIRTARENIDAGRKALEEGLKAYSSLPMIEREATLWKEFQIALAEWKRDHEEITGLAARVREGGGRELA